jgi:hypothetical protein
VTAHQPPLFPPGWDEPCGDADEQPRPRRVDFGALLERAHAEYAAQRRRWVDGVPADDGDEPLHPLGDGARSASRDRRWNDHLRDVAAVIDPDYPDDAHHFARWL